MLNQTMSVLPQVIRAACQRNTFAACAAIAGKVSSFDCSLIWDLANNWMLSAHMTVQVRSMSGHAAAQAFKTLVAMFSGFCVTRYFLSQTFSKLLL